MAARRKRDGGLDLWATVDALKPRVYLLLPGREECRERQQFKRFAFGCYLVCFEWPRYFSWEIEPVPEVAFVRGGLLEEVD